MHFLLKFFSSMRRSLLRSANVILLGAPGGGKGTISKYLVKDFGFFHVSTGDLLRKNIAEGTPVGKQCKEIVSAGGLVPDELVFDLLKTEIAGKKSLLFDGFPRTREQAESLKSIVQIDTAIQLDIPHTTIVDRISKRWVHAPSGRVYAYDFNPPKKEGFDDETGEPLTQRSDDKPDVVKNRLEQYEKSTQPVVDYYAAAGLLQRFAGTESKVIYKDILVDVNFNL